MKPAIFYIFFQVIVILIYLVMISLVSFFHFLLGHEFQLIEAWSVRNAWEIIGLTKLLSFGLMIKIIDVRFPTETYLKNIFMRNKRPPDWSIITFVIFTYCYFYFSNSMTVSDMPISLLSLLSAVLGSLIFYATDFFLIYAIDQAFPEQRFSHRFLNGCLFTILFYLTTKVLMPFHKELNPMIFFHYMNILFIFEIFKDKWTNPFAYILLLVCPMGVIWGFDPVWEQNYSFFKLTTRPNYAVTLILWILSIYYLYRRNKRVRSRLIRKKA